MYKIGNKRVRVKSERKECGGWKEYERKSKKNEGEKEWRC